MVSHDPPCQMSTHVAGVPEEHSHHLLANEGGEKKGQVQQVNRKRRLARSASEDLDELRQLEDDIDYQPPSSPASAQGYEPSAKRRHVEEADEKQSGCTDEWQPPSSPLHEEEEDDIEEEDSSEQDEEDIPHPAPRTWVAKVEWALGRRGGKGTLADIYSTIEEAFPEEVDGKRNWKAAIRSCLSKNEKRKFYKPHSSSSYASGKDHLWCLVAPRDGATRPPAKRGRPAGRRATTSRRTTTRQARRSSPEVEQSVVQEEPDRQVTDELELPDVLLEQFAKEERMAELLRQKELLEQDINRLLQQQDTYGDGLSPDQEDFLSHLLG